MTSAWELHFSQWAGAFSWPVEGLLRLLLAAVCGGLMGFEREMRGRQAGFRTFILVCLGSALVMMVSIEFALHRWTSQSPNLGININIDPARIAYGVMTGVGFLGAGTIIQHKGSIRGLTTAAGLWCAAAVGLAAGFGMYTMTILATLLVLLALSVLNYIEDFIPKYRYRTVTLRIAWHAGCIAELVRRFKRAGLRISDVSFERIGDLTQADVHLQIAFTHKAQHYSLAHEIEGDPSITLIATREM